MDAAIRKCHTCFLIVIKAHCISLTFFSELSLQIILTRLPHSSKSTVYIHKLVVYQYQLTNSLRLNSSPLCCCCVTFLFVFDAENDAERDSDDDVHGPHVRRVIFRAVQLTPVPSVLLQVDALITRTCIYYIYSTINSACQTTLKIDVTTSIDRPNDVLDDKPRCQAIQHAASKTVWVLHAANAETLRSRTIRSNVTSRQLRLNKSPSTQ